MSNDMYVHCVSNSCMSEYNLSKKKKIQWNLKI